jgi:hypothetical protein
MDEFVKYELKKFEDSMVIHLRQVFSNKIKGLPEEALRDMIQRGISVAENYGIRIEDDVKRYIDLMFILSEDFDTSVESSWTRDILKKEEMEPEERLNKIFDHLEGH